MLNTRRRHVMLQTLLHPQLEVLLSFGRLLMSASTTTLHPYTLHGYVRLSVCLQSPADGGSEILLCDVLVHFPNLQPH